MTGNLKAMFAGLSLAILASFAPAARADIYLDTHLFGNESVVGGLVFYWLGGEDELSLPYVERGFPAAVQSTYGYVTDCCLYGDPVAGPAPEGSSVITPPETANLIGRGGPFPGLKVFELGIISDAPLAATGGVPILPSPISSMHLVVLANTAYSTNDAIGKAFGTGLAGYFTEDEMIAAILTDDGRYFGGPLMQPILQDLAVEDLLTFGADNGDTLAFPIPSTYDVVAWSNGQLVGTGVARTSPTASAVPEPASWTLMLIGFGALGTLLRSVRRRLMSPRPAGGEWARRIATPNARRRNG